MQIFVLLMITEFPSVQQRELFSQASLEMPLFRLIEIMKLPIVRQSDAKIQKRWVKSLQLYLTGYPNWTFVLSLSCIWCYKVVYIHENWIVNLCQRIISELQVSPYTSLHRSRELNFHRKTLYSHDCLLQCWWIFEWSLNIDGIYVIEESSIR